MESQIAELEAEIGRRMVPFQEAVARWMTIPGINEIAAWNLVAEIGAKMKRFLSPQHLARFSQCAPTAQITSGGRTHPSSCR